MAEDDDYFSDKYLVESSLTGPTTYSNKRKEAEKNARLRNEQNRKKSRHQREIESREGGLSKSLFQRAKEEEDAGIGSGNKALAIMMKMGFKPGQSLGIVGNDDGLHDDLSTTTTADNNQPVSTSSSPIVVNDHPSRLHNTEPLPLHEWAGKKGIGLGRRARSPSTTERLAKMAKMEEDLDHRDFRDRARDEYQNRQAEGRLGPAQRSLITLDEQKGKPFNILSLNPHNHDTFPIGLIDALSVHSNLAAVAVGEGEPIAIRLRKQMQNDALQPHDNDYGDGLEMPATKKSTISAEDLYSFDLLEEATQFLRLQTQDRLQLVLSYLRDEHSYCFWCGVEYNSQDDLQNQCPGTNEDDHD